MPPPGTRPPQKKQGRDHETALYEGLKRAQRSRLEDQRGTEINSELPDFLRKKTVSLSGFFYSVFYVTELMM